MSYDAGEVGRVKEIYRSVQAVIERRLADFRMVWENGTDERIFAEMAFCLLTPQSRARVCWAAIERLADKGLLLAGDESQIMAELTGVRFKIRKAGYIVSAREQFARDGRVGLKNRIARFSSPARAREWLVKDVKGLGYKEASHFLRNIGLGEDLTILDRHVLKNLKRLEVIQEIPSSLSRKKYLEIEGKMKDFARKVDIPVAHLDLVLWYREAGEVFK